MSRAGSKPRCIQVARYVKAYQAKVVINSDAHNFTSVGLCDHALDVAEEAGLNQEQILNSSVRRVKAYLTHHRCRVESITATLPAIG